MVEIEDLSFMTGCWTGSFVSERGTGTIEEQYTAPAKNMMLGTTRYIVDSLVVQFEFTKIETSDEGIVLTPFPGGAASEHDFELSDSDDRTAIFVAPEHDFPKRIIYTAEDGTLTAHLDDGVGGEVQEWEMRKTSCS